MPWVRILLLFEAFATVFQSQISRWCRRNSRRAYLAIVELFLAMSEGLEAIFFLSFSFFLVGSVGDVSRVLLACVLHALGTNPAAVRGFRNRFPKPNFEMMSARFQTSVPGYSRIVSCDVGRPGGYLFSFLFFLFSGFRRRRFESFIGLCFACLGHESCCCSRLSQPFSKAKFRDDVGAIPDERTWLYSRRAYLPFLPF